jgi:nucleoside-diphosphate-sugar epimerase
VKSVLITGSSGFVGRHFIKKLEDDNELHLIDIKDGQDARDYFRFSDKRYDLVIHLAAVVGGRETIEREPLKVAVDLSIDAEMFQWALRTKPSRVVYFSSSAAYPISYQSLYRRTSLWEDAIDLNSIMSPDMTYGFAKLAGEYQAKFLAEAGINTHVFRPFSGYGEDQDLSYPFPSFIARGARREDPFPIWGDGNACRDFIHIDDIVDAVLKAIDEDIRVPVNLGTGIATSFNSLASTVAEQVGYSPQFEHLLDKPVGVEYRVCTSELMRSFYTPKISLEEGVARSLRAAGV